MAADPVLQRVLARVTVAAAANHCGRFDPPFRVRCPKCDRHLPAGWGARWSCVHCATGGDQIDYLTTTGLSFPQARSLLVTNGTSWSGWEKASLRAALPVPFVLARLGVTPEHGRIRCLNTGGHARGDVDPSCSLYRDAVHCFACGFHADVFGVWEQAHQVDFRTAWSELLGMAQGLEAPAVWPESCSDRTSRDGEQFAELYAEVLQCCEPLVDTAGATYLSGRGIDPAAAQQLGVRWMSNPALGRVQALLARRERAGEAGLLDEAGFYTLRRHRLHVPAQRDGAVVWLQARSTNPSVAKRYRWRSLTGIVPCPLGLPRLLASAPTEPVLVAEGPTDWLALACRGWTVIGVPGASGPATWWLRLLAGRHVVLCQDQDAAGEASAKLWRERLTSICPRVERLTLPPGTDWCDSLFLEPHAGPARLAALLAPPGDVG